MNELTGERFLQSIRHLDDYINSLDVARCKLLNPRQDILDMASPGSRIKSLIVRRGEDFTDLEYVLTKPQFERIRRITGYLVGTTDRWNNAKSAELKDRVTHE